MTAHDLAARMAERHGLRGAIAKLSDRMDRNAALYTLGCITLSQRIQRNGTYGGARYLLDLTLAALDRAYHT